MGEAICSADKNSSVLLASPPKPQLPCLPMQSQGEFHSYCTFKLYLHTLWSLPLSLFHPPPPAPSQRSALFSPLFVIVCLVLFIFLCIALFVLSSSNLPSSILLLSLYFSNLCVCVCVYAICENPSHSSSYLAHILNLCRPKEKVWLSFKSVICSTCSVLPCPYVSCHFICPLTSAVTQLMWHGMFQRESRVDVDLHFHDPGCTYGLYRY